MDRGLSFLVLALATWRCASLLAREAGPFDVLERIRFLVGVRYAPDGMPIGTNTVAEGVLCVWCNSVWFGVLWAAFYVWFPAWAVGLGLPLALSAAAMFLEGVAHGEG